MPKPTRLIAGAMSGTSGDGVDVAIVQISGSGLDMTARLLKHHHVPFDAKLRTELFSIRDTQQLHLRDLAALGRAISLTYARAANEALMSAGLKSADLSALAAHGQTLFHDPPTTIQWFDPALVAAEVGCTVISDFRRADLAAGGQGAPLVPFADYIFFRHPQRSRVLLNIGGIANLTWLPAGSGIDDVIAFDTGPGNCISDWLIRTRLNENRGFDAGGLIALTGMADWSIVQSMRAHDYFNRHPPKSTDGPAMIALFQSCCDVAGKTQATLNDALATAGAITAQTIADAIRSLGAGRVDEVIVSGGGAHNRCIMDGLRDALNNISLRKLDELGMTLDAKEAVAFALLGAATLEGLPSNVPQVTGARRQVVLGSITPRP